MFCTLVLMLTIMDSPLHTTKNTLSRSPNHQTPKYEQVTVLVLSALYKRCTNI